MENLVKLKIPEEFSSKDLIENYENFNEISKISHDNLSYDDFFSKYMTPNIPLRIELNVTEWDSYNNWITHFNSNEDEEVKNDLNMTYLREKIGNLKVPVAKCSEKYFDSHQKTEMNFFDFLENHWKNSDTEFYLKDWHLQKYLPRYQFYTVPEYFASDFLNEYLCDTGQDDYKFVYIGPESTYTPFHADVFSSFSWSVNIFGRKSWVILPPGEEEKVRDVLGNLPFLVEEHILLEKNVKYFKIQQEAGEALFVPSNWHHQVVNETNTISINHNWFNACNLKYIWKSMKTSLNKVEKEINDCRDMDNFELQCQLLLKSLFGMDYKGLLLLLMHITEKRVKSIRNREPLGSFDTYIFDQNHLLYDLKRIRIVVREIAEEEHIDSLKLMPVCDEILRLIGGVLSG